MARNNNRPSNNNRRARNNMSSYIPQARQSIQDNPLRQLNLRNANTRIETSNGDFNWTLLGNEPEQPQESFWNQVARMNNGTWIQDPSTAFRASSDIEDRPLNVTGPDGNNYWISMRELEVSQSWERQTQELLAGRMFSEQYALGRDLSVDMEALEEATGTQYSDNVERYYAAYQSAGISWRDIPTNTINSIPPEPGSIGGPYEDEALNESFRRLSDAGRALAQSLEEMAPGNPELSRLAQRVRELQGSSGMAASYRRSRRTGYSGLSGIADGQYIRYGTPGEVEPDKVYGERMDNMIIIENDSSPLMSWVRESQGWGRGYVIVRKSSYLYHVPLQEIATLFDVHGGITCQSIISPMDIESWGKYLHLTDEDLDHLILGFDTSHHNNEGFKTREQVLEETRKLQLQIASYG